MFCPKCGVQNPETGKFCRSCGTDLGNVSQALTGNLPKPVQIYDRKGKPISWEGAIVKLFTGLAFIVVSIALAFSNMGHGWWFWMLIPGFTSLGAGVAQYIQLKKLERGTPAYSPAIADSALPPGQNQSSLPPTQTEYVSPESRYKTGELVPPSVTEGTTRHLEVNSEGETMTLPKQKPTP
jgi:hypothetical protein